MFLTVVQHASFPVLSHMSVRLCNFSQGALFCLFALTHQDVTLGPAGEDGWLHSPIAMIFLYKGDYEEVPKPGVDPATLLEMHPSDLRNLYHPSFETQRRETLPIF